MQVRAFLRGVAQVHVTALALLAALLFASSAAHAQATRTWVSGVGDDANPCSRTAPCKTFAGAISKTAAGGEINVLDPGGFGAVTITKSIVIDGGGGLTAGVLASLTTGVIINAAPGDAVELRNLDLHGMWPGGNQGLNGVRVMSAGSVLIDRVHIHGFSTTGVLVNAGANAKVMIQNSQITQNGPAIGISNLDVSATPTAGSVVYVSNSTLFGNLSAFDSPNVGPIKSFNNNRLEGNTNPSTPTDTIYER